MNFIATLKIDEIKIYYQKISIFINFFFLRVMKKSTISLL
jgi:hypothetical protein